MKKTILLLLSSFIFMLMPIFPSFGADNSGNVEVLLLIDNSGSMRQSDPQNLRWAGGQLLVDTLKEGDSIGVISFAASPTLVVPMTEVGSPGAKERIKKAFESMSSQGGTDLLKALDLASTTIEQEKAGNVQVIVMSDGVVDLSDTAGAVDTAQYMQDLDAKSSWFKQREIPVSGISFSRSDKEVLEPFATSTGGEYYYIEDQAELVPLYYKIIAGASARDVTEAETVSKEKSVNISPGMEQVIITCTGSNAAGVVLLGPDGQKITASAQTQVITADYYKIYKISSPPPGTWKVQAADPDVQVLVETDVAKGVHPSGRLEQEKIPLGEKVLLQVTAGAVGSSECSVELKFTPSDGSTPLVLPLYDDGTHGDKVSGDNLFSLEYTFTRPGDFKVTALVYQDGKPAGVWTGSRTVRALPSIHALNTPDTIPVGSPVQFQAELLFKGSRITDPFAVKAVISGDEGTEVVSLNDSGRSGDLKVGDGIYSGEWTPDKKGKFTVQYQAQGVLSGEEERFGTDPQEVSVVDPPAIALTGTDVRWHLFKPSVLNASLTFSSTSLAREEVSVAIDQKGWVLNRESFWVTPGVSKVSLDITKTPGAQDPGEGLTLRLNSEVPLDGQSILLPVPSHLGTIGLVGGVILLGIVVFWRLGRKERLSGILVFEEGYGSRVIDLKHFRRTRVKLTFWPGEKEPGVGEKKQPLVLSLARQRTKEALFDGDILLTVERGELYELKGGLPEPVDRVNLSDGLELVADDLSVKFLDRSSNDMEQRTELDRRLKGK